MSGVDISQNFFDIFFKTVPTGNVSVEHPCVPQENVWAGVGIL